MGTAIATGRFAKNGYIQFKKVVWFIVAALIGSSIGSNLTLLVSDKILQYMMIVILPIVAFYVMRNKKMGDDSLAGTLPERKSFLIALASALIIGIYDGFYGPGTGTFLLLVLTGAARYTMKEAAGTTKAINLSSNVAAFQKRAIKRAMVDLPPPDGPTSAVKFPSGIFRLIWESTCLPLSLS